MDIIDYLKKYHNVPLKEEPFNECDALIFSLVSYFPYEKLEKPKPKYKAKELYERLIKYYDPRSNQRKTDLLVLLKEICLAKRYKGILFFNFEQNIDHDNFMQFQAISVGINDFIFLSFCGTNATATGWREDLNMAFMDIVPGEFEAMRYANDVAKHNPLKHLYFGGHSKGGRLAMRAAKSIEKKERIIGVYNFDGPNFLDGFYDEEYSKMEPKLYEYAPSESIIGRLFSTPPYIQVVASNRHLLNQHDSFQWIIKDKEFVREVDFTKRSTDMVNALNTTIGHYPDEIKQSFVDTVFDIIDHLEITDFSDTPKVMYAVKQGLSELPTKWKHIPKETRKVLTRVLLTLIKEYIRSRVQFR